MKKQLTVLVLCCVMVFGALQAHAASAVRIVDSAHMDLTAINAVEGKSSGGVPVGTVIVWPVANNPEDAEKWLECNGQSISSAQYPELVALVGGRVPDYQGLFLRGEGTQSFSQNNGSTVGVTATVHQSGSLGHVQGDSSRNIQFDTSANTFPSQQSTGGSFDVVNGVLRRRTGQRAFSYNGSYCYWMGIGLDFSRVIPTSNENRPVNTAVRYLVRALP